MKLKSERDLKFKCFLIKNLPYYVQSEENTCGAAIALIILNYYFGKQFPLNKETEMKIFKKIKFRKYDYGNFCKLANLLANYGLNTKLIFNGPNLKHPLFKNQSFKNMLKQYHSCLKQLSMKKKVKIIKKNFTIFDIMTDLSRGYLVISEIKYPSEELTHTILLRGFNGRKIYYIDPLVKNGGRSCYYKVLEDKINLKAIKNYIAVKN